jgi:ATP adenylyltransferase
MDPEDGCLFCNLKLLDDADALIVHRGLTAYVVLNRFPYTNGHLMVTPFAHRSGLSTLTPAERSELMDLGAACESVLRQEYRPQGFNMGINLGKAAGAGVEDHVHLHVVPRWGGDVNFLSVIGSTRIVPEDLATTHARLRNSFSTLSAGSAGPADV